MKAIIEVIAATMHGNEGQITISIDEFGPVMTFTAFVGGRNIKSVLTGDDALAADSYIASGGKLKDAWIRAHAVKWVFEAGLDMNWDGTFHEKLFAEFPKAEAYAKNLQESDGEWGEVYIRAVQLH
jgi:hypothetical protein